MSDLIWIKTVCLKEFSEKVEFQKNLQMTEKHSKFPSIQRVNNTVTTDIG